MVKELFLREFLKNPSEYIFLKGVWRPDEIAKIIMA